MSADKMDCLWSTGVQGGAQRGVGGGGKLMRADGKGKNVKKERTGKSFSRTYPPHPRISAMKDKKWSDQEN